MKARLKILLKQLGWYQPLQSAYRQTLYDYVQRLTTAGFAVKVIPAEELTAFNLHVIQAGKAVVLGYKLP